MNTLIIILLFPLDAFNRQFLPGLPYRLGENASPNHSPPIGVTPSSNQTSTATAMSQNVSPYNLPVLIRPQPQLPQNAAQMAAMVAALNQNHHQTAPSASQASPLRIRINSPTRINSTSSASSNDIITTNSGGSPTIPGATNHHFMLSGTHLARMSHMSHLHRPFESSSPKSTKDNS